MTLNKTNTDKKILPKKINECALYLSKDKNDICIPLSVVDTLIYPKLSPSDVVNV